MFERNALKWLKEWKGKANRKPLIIRGARQEGKTSLVDVFSKEFDCYLKFNLDIAEDLALFTKEMSIHELYSILLAMRGKTKDEGTTLIFIDEIQNSPLAIKMLRYFKEELPQVYVIAAGSLLETMLKDNESISFPVGRVEYMALRPCTFAIRFWNKPMRQDRVTLDNGKEYTLYSLPYYYAGQLGKVLDKIINTNHL